MFQEGKNHNFCMKKKERSGCGLSDECELVSVSQDGCKFPLISQGKTRKHSKDYTVLQC